MRFPFDYSLYPPAPALEIRLFDPLSRSKSNYLLAAIDTGADTCVIPLHLIAGIGSRPLRKQSVRGLWGGRSTVSLFSIDIEVSGILFTGVETIGSEDDKTLLIGRNLTNRFRMVIDGPEMTVTVDDE